MPIRPKHKCNHYGCTELTYGTYCDLHKRQQARRYDEKRGTRQERGYDDHWLKVRKAFLAENPLCHDCKEEGHYLPSEEAHHIIPISKGGAVYDWNNLMPLCKHHHSIRTGKEK